MLLNANKIFIPRYNLFCNNQYLLNYDIFHFMVFIVDVMTN